MTKTHESVQTVGVNLAAKFDVLSRELWEEIQCLNGDMKQVKGGVELMEHKLEKTNSLCEAELEEITIMEARIKEFQLRFQGIPEQPGEDIRLRKAKALAQLINKEEKDFNKDMDKTYRVNSRFATMRKLHCSSFCKKNNKLLGYGLPF